MEAGIKDRHKLNGLHPIFKEKMETLIQEMIAKGYPMRIVWGKRTKKENDALVKRGTASKTSKHLKGKAIDIIHRVHAYRSNDENKKYWQDLKEVAESLGLIWGGGFSSRFDPTHVEMR